MSYRLRKLWDKDPMSATKECCFHVILMAFMVLLFLSDCFTYFPPMWQIFIVLVISGLFIWALLYSAKVLQKSKDKEEQDNVTKNG